MNDYRFFCRPFPLSLFPLAFSSCFWLPCTEGPELFIGFAAGFGAGASGFFAWPGDRSCGATAGGCAACTGGWTTWTGGGAAD